MFLFRGYMSSAKGSFFKRTVFQLSFVEGRAVSFDVGDDALLPWNFRLDLLITSVFQLLYLKAYDLSSTILSG